MSVNQEIVEYNSSDQIIEEFSIIDGFKGFIDSKLPADISYFNHSKIDEVFRELDRNNGQSEDYAYVLSSIIVNIGNAARQPTSLEKCYQQSVRYRGTITYYFNKYKSKLSVASKSKLRHSIERQFKHFEFNPIKMALRSIKVGGVPLTRVPTKVLKLSAKTVKGSTINSLVDMYTNWLAIKYYDLLEAVRVYKRAANSEYDLNDVKSIYVSSALKEEADYFYNTAYAILEDMLKVYNEL